MAQQMMHYSHMARQMSTTPTWPDSTHYSHMARQMPHYSHMA